MKTTIIFILNYLLNLVTIFLKVVIFFTTPLNYIQMLGMNENKCIGKNKNKIRFATNGSVYLLCTEFRLL